jgi:aspartyl-tRNA(Asn)/glutamyl-tRNA(Gln) amidotransferase subunit B
MRAKEDAQDYRYFIDPDLLPIVVSESKIQQIKTELPELPLKKAARFVKDLGLSESEAETLTNEKSIADFFEKTAAIHGHNKQASNWILGEVLRYMNEHHQTIQTIKVNHQELAELIRLVEKKVLSLKIAKTVFNEMMTSGETAAQIIDKHGYKQVSDTGELEKIIARVLDENPAQVLEYQSGKEKVFGFFVGAVMKLSKGQADPDAVNTLLKQKLGKK